MSLTVTCDRCHAELEHVCNKKLVDAARALYAYAPGFMLPGVIRDGKKSGMYAAGDETAPFVSEAYLYNLLGKEDARTVLALFANVIRAAGLNPSAIEHNPQPPQTKEKR